MTAPVQDVADLAFSAASGAIALDPVLSKLLHVREHLKTIIHRETKAELQIMTFDPAVVTGQKVAGALIDELHVVAKMSKAASAIRQLRGGMLPFPEAFLAFITTQSEDAPAAPSLRADEGPGDPGRQAGRRDAAGAVRIPGKDAEGPAGMAGPEELGDGDAERRALGRSIDRLVEEFATARRAAKKSSAPGRRST
jgi:hypothetical protein